MTDAPWRVEGGGIWTHGGLEGTRSSRTVSCMSPTDGLGVQIDTHGGQGTRALEDGSKTDQTGPAQSRARVDNRGVALWGQPGHLAHA